MPYKDKEKQKEWRENNKEYMKEYYEKNKEKKKEYYKEYRENNKEKIKEYKQTEAGIKSHRIVNWKKYGIKSDDYNSLHEYYLSVKNCEECDVELVDGLVANGKCLDHDHFTGLVRNVLCRSCNVKRRQ